VVQDLAFLHGAILDCILLKAINLLYGTSSFSYLSSNQKILFDRLMDDAWTLSNQTKDVNMQ